MSASLWLDHVAIHVPVLAAAVERLGRLGLRATVSPAAPDRHSRVYLHRSYLEVAAVPGGVGWDAALFFLRFEDATALRAHLDGAGLAYRFAEYDGVDGTWDDVVIDAGSAGPGGTVPLPILVRRTAPPEIARNWPPPLGEPHRCGARTLAEVHVGVPSVEDAFEAFGRLLGLDRMPEPFADPRSGRTRIDLPLAAGSIALLTAGAGGIERIVLDVGSLETAGSVFGERPVRQGNDPVAWLDPSGTSGLELGFAEG